MRKGRLQRCGHDDRPWRRAPAKACALLWLTKLEQRTREEVVGCWGASGATAVKNGRLVASCARLWRRRSCGRSATAAARKKGGQKRNGSSEGVGRTLAGLRPRPGASWPARTDRRRRVAVSRATRRAVSETGRPLCRSIQFISDPMLCLTVGFSVTKTS